MNPDVLLSPAALVSECQVIVFDCDGVLIDSNQIKEDAFAFVTENYFGTNAAQFIRTFHRTHGGLSRVIKFEAVVKGFTPLKPVTVEVLCREFEIHATQMLLRCPLALDLEIVLATLKALGKHLIVLSGTPENSLGDLLTSRELSQFFEKILGSPRSKFDYLTALHADGVLDKNRPFLFVGDSMTDFEAAEKFSNCRFLWSEEFAACPMKRANTAKIAKLRDLALGK